MKPVVCFGEALIDFLAAPQRDPLQPRAFLQHAGGAPANVAVAVARLGAPSAFIGMLGADLFGDFLLQSLLQYGVDTRFVRRTAEAKTALAFVALDAQGERSFSFYRPPAADLLFRNEHYSDDAFAHAGAFHVCSNSLTEPEIAQATLAGVRRARAQGVLVSFDMNLRPALWSSDTDPAPRAWEALQLADVVKLSADELRYLSARCGDDASVFSKLWQGNARALVVTDGAHAVQWRTPTQHGEVPAFGVHAIDTTAAGDAFVGGLLHELSRHQVTPNTLVRFTDDHAAMNRTVRFAAACGAVAVTRHGAFSAMPTLAEVAALMQPQHPAMSATRQHGSELST